ncbi:ABC transporter permease [Tessaracoccus rhinocerotis]|uniref:ABC transporter permease n=1 Tax=Tessaracoccus rhinocerotis TaxID=1689449 RepID=A0A553JZ21_9ACTN|nr:ABC transporter permease [Tessaracoccus rhinocerotis]TRY17699.1 ABC transporter permease [Tessaracoccus rhinocerotis]
MTRHLLFNLGRSVLVLFVVTFIVFALMYGDGYGIAYSVLGLTATPEAVEAKVVALGLDRPLLTQFGDWLGGAFTGDLGRSFYTGQSVSEALSTRVPVTLSVVIPTLVLTAVISVLLGVTAAVRGGVVDRVVQVISVGGTAVPSFIVAIALVFTFAIRWRFFPATGYTKLSDSPTAWLASVALPMVALLIGAVASAAQQFRTAVLDTIGRDYVRTLRARGVRESNIIFGHVLRNAAAPGLTVISLTVFGLLGGAVFIEQVFVLPGMGQLANMSAQISDVPMVMGTVLVMVLIVLVVNFTTDLAINLLNPKARTR